MEEKSSFQFNGYEVKKSLIELKEINSEDLTINFEPSGIIDNSSNTFILNLFINVFDQNKNINIEVDFSGKFSFLTNDINLQNFMYLNAPAILFPYIRAYITALTALSGISPITLPTMNLKGLKEQLEQKITEIN